MKIEEQIFKRIQINFRALSDFGFEQSDGKWIYIQDFLDGAFRAVIEIDNNGHITGNVYETDSNEIYIPLRVESMDSGFVGKVRGEYVQILENIKSGCCEANYFIYPQANRLAQAIYQKYGDRPTFPWEKLSGFGVFRNPDNRKWYAVVMNLNRQKFDKGRSGEFEAVNIKLNEAKISNLLGQKGFYPAYHMNKKYWITVSLDDTLQDDVIFSLLEESHRLTEKKKK